MPAAASGAVRRAAIPVTSNGIGPSTRTHRQCGSMVTPAGTAAVAQTIDSSSRERLMETNSPRGQDGIGALAGRRQTAKSPVTSVSRRELGADAPNCLEQVCRLERLVHDGCDVSGHRPQDSFRRRGQEYDSLQKLGSLFPQMTHHGHPALVRHHQVEEDHVERSFLDGRDGVLAIADDINLVSVTLENLGYEPLDRRIVIEEEHVATLFPEQVQHLNA